MTEGADKKPGFRRPEKTAVLVLTGDYRDAEVRVNLSIPFEIYFELERLVNEGEGKELFTLFMEKAVLGWNLEEDDGSPTPVTVEGLLSWPPEMAKLLISAYLEASVNPHSPLSSNGSLSNGTAPSELELDLGNMSVPG